MNKLIPLCIILIFNNFCFSQISENGIPRRFQNLTAKKISFIEMPKFDKNKLLSEKLNLHKTLLFGKIFDTAINICKSNYCEVLPNGKLFLLGITSKNALSIQLIFKQFRIPKGAELFIFSFNKQHFIGKFTEKNNTPSTTFPLAPVSSDSIVIEYFEPENAEFTAFLEIGQIVHDFVGIKNLLNSGSCNRNVNCPEGQNWQNEKRATCKLTYSRNGSRYLGTGCLINNTNFDGIPYVLTANHCISTQEEAESALFFFNYESTTCDGSYGNENQTISGSTLVATAPNHELDFALLRLNQAIPRSYNVFFAGWNRSINISGKTVCLHHPSGDIKKISVDNEAPQTGNFGEGYNSNSHWKIARWDIGTTEPGSSGAPLFNVEHQIIGNLTGGEASCANSVNDYFAKIDRSWNEYNLENQQLKRLLDPLNVGCLSLEGFDPEIGFLTLDAELLQVLNPKKENCNTTKIQPTILIQNKGKDTLTSLQISYSIDNQQIKSMIWQGNLSYMKIDTVVFSNIDSNLVNFHTFKIWISKPNNKTDENHKNDTILTNFNNKSGKEVALNLQTDNYANEFSWKILSDSNVLYKNPQYFNNQQYSDTFCLANGCYTFFATDSGQDGICCNYGNGNLELKNVKTQEIFISQGKFGKFLSRNFCIYDSIFQNDAEILEILSPKTQNYCNSQKIKPKILIRNNGKNLLKSLLITCKYGTSDTITKKWTGRLKYTESETVEFDSIFFDKTQYFFEVSISKFNDSIPENFTENNVKKLNFNILTEKTPFTLEIKTDKFGSETKWQVLENENVIYEGGPYKNNFQHTIIENFCLSAGCYTFEFFDERGDGICCNYGVGFVHLFNEVTKDFRVKDSIFTNFVTRPFCTYKLDIQDVTNLKEIKIFPNPVSEILFFEKSIENIEIFNTFGNLILTRKNVSQINFSQFPSGIYVVKIFHKRSFEIRKIIKL